ncbi:hypothetical protein DPMN_004067 [Dreissena polymorpha]|uniref:Uncharacterized protein n=1 Tax=Dreissena polymorpha TaxID=45954 RepID=A0A9D4RVB0_DREPO|nr:hypothetical protein DPMN_004067 [Dreissena polymorpha]
MGLYQFSGMCFCIDNALSTFERLMENVHGGLQWEICLLYMDNISYPCSVISDDELPAPVPASPLQTHTPLLFKILKLDTKLRYTFTSSR